MSAADLVQSSADDLASAAEKISKVAIELKGVSTALTTDPEQLRLTALGIQAEAMRLAMAAVVTARAGERLATVAVYELGSR
jgi:hypothetical protein